MTDDPFEFCPTPGKWEHRGITVGNLRKMFDKFEDDFVFDVIAILEGDDDTSGKIMAIYPHRPPMTDEDRSNIVLLKYAKETTDLMMEMGKAFGWDREDAENEEEGSDGSPS